MKPVSLKTQRILMWIPYLNCLNWFIWIYQIKALRVTDWMKPSLVAGGLFFGVFLADSILMRLLPDTIWFDWLGLWLAGFVVSRYLIRVQEQMDK